MKYYEIRVLNQQGRASLIYHRLYSDNTVAIRSAKNIADGQPFEVWRGMDCIHLVMVDRRTKPS